MKKTLNYLIFLPLIGSLNCQSKTIISAPRDTKYVAAKTGLNIRAEPSIKAKVLKVLPYATEFEILDRSNTPETIDGITAKWLRVSTAETTGWVFGGYVSDDISTKAEWAWFFAISTMDSWFIQEGKADVTMSKKQFTAFLWQNENGKKMLWVTIDGQIDGNQIKATAIRHHTDAGKYNLVGKYGMLIWKDFSAKGRESIIFTENSPAGLTIGLTREVY